MTSTSNKNKKQSELPKHIQEKFQRFEKQLGIKFKTRSLLYTAFTHSSYVNEHRRKNFIDNERLEFLGDAVLELSVSQFLYKTEPLKNEGELTKLRASIVCEPALFSFAKELSFGQFVILGKGEEQTGGRNRPALLADVFEAFVGALYMDQGMEAVDEFLSRFVFPKIKNGAFSHVMDYKSRLQEMIQQRNSGQLHYEIIEEKGPAHEKEFKTVVLLDDKKLGTGQGKSKKEAEQEAARKAIGFIESRQDEE